MKTNTKHCNKCDRDKELSEFYRNQSAKDGLQHYCKPCGKASTQSWRKLNPEKVNDSAYNKRWRAANKEHLSDYNKEWREGNKVRVSAYRKSWAKENRGHLREYRKNRHENNPLILWVSNTRSYLSRIIKGKGSHQPTLDLLGCTRQEYRDHLESQFNDGMSWENYGEWQVDHVIPVSAFDQSDLEQRKECWHYSNTQPLWAKENWAKGSKLPTE